jgi:hypothetical protein
MSSITFDLNLFLQESKNTLLNPKRYFSTMKIFGGLAEPLIKAAAYGMLTGLIYLIFWFFRIKSFGAGYVGDAAGFLAFIKIIIMTAISSAIGALLLVVISTSCRGNSDYEPNLRVTASLFAVMPVYAIFSVLWELNLYLGIIGSFIISIYFIWILYSGLIVALKCKQKNVKFALYGFALIIVLLLMLNLRSSGKQENIKSEAKKPSKEIKKN